MGKSVAPLQVVGSSLMVMFTKEHLPIRVRAYIPVHKLPV